MILSRHSLTRRVTALHALASALILAGIAAVVTYAVDRHFEELDVETLDGKVEMIRELAGNATSAEALSARLDAALKGHHGLYVIVDSSQGRLYSNVLADPAGWPVSAAPTPTLVRWRADGRDYKAVTAEVPASASGASGLRLRVAIDDEHHAHFLRDLRRTLWIYAAAAAVLSGLLGGWAAYTGLRPLREIGARARGVTGQRLAERMPVDSVPAEMAELAQSLNDMLERLQRDFTRLTEFSSDLAHELRTPLSNLLTQTQVVLAQDRDASTYRTTLESNAEELQRLSRMVSDMLLLARTEHGLALPTLEAVSLAGEARAAIDFYEALAEEKALRLSVDGDAEVDGDRSMLRRAISNLMSNAVRHTPPDGRVRIIIRRLPDHAELALENTGGTIPPDVLPRLFDRFFRADPSRRTLDSEGAGLGLAIVRSIVLAHHGTVDVSSTAGVTRFSMRLPYRPPASLAVGDHAGTPAASTVPGQAPGLTGG